MRKLFDSHAHLSEPNVCLMLLACNAIALRLFFFFFIYLFIYLFIFVLMLQKRKEEIRQIKKVNIDRKERKNE